MAVEVATAYVSLQASTRDFEKSVKAALNGVSAKSAGDRMGSEITARIRERIGGSSGIRASLESSTRGAGAGSAKKFFEEFDTTSKRIGAISGLVIGKTIGAGITAGMAAVSIGGAVFAKLEVAAKASAVKMGAAMAAAIRGALATTGVGLGIAGVASAGGVLMAGLDRLKTIQRAQVQLSLKLPPEEIKRVTKDITDVVSGTPIALDQALQAVPRALSAGIKPGRELNAYVKSIADAAASTGGQAGFGQVDLIFGQILAKGKLMGEEMMQLAENGVDIRTALKDTFNWDDKQLAKQIAKGKVGMAEVQKAVEATWGKDGGLAKKMGETFEGATGNLKASMARLGAGILGAIFGKEGSDDPLTNATSGVKALTGHLDTAGKWVAAHREDIRDTFEKGGKAVKFAYEAVKTLVGWFGKAKDMAGDIGDAIGRAFDRAADAVGRVKTKITDTITSIKTKLTEAVDGVKKIWDGIFGENGWFAEQFKKVERLIGNVKDALGFGTATANAADSVPFNAGPRAPGAPSSRTGSREPGWGGAAASSGPREPYGLPRGTNTGGYGTGSDKVFPAWVMSIAKEFGIKPSTYPTHQEENRNEPGYAPNPQHLNRGIDWVGPVENLQRFADYLETIPDAMEQVIWQNPNTKRKTGIGGGRIVSGEGYYDDGTYAQHGGNDPNNIHVHTRQSMSIPLPGGGSGDNSIMPPATGKSDAPADKSLWQRFKDWAGFSGGGSVFGAGTATSDSIPAMLSNGEHVLTADDVKKAGGQGAIYRLRAALQAGNLPGFAGGGAVDPDEIAKLQAAQDDAAHSLDVARARMGELPEDASESQRLSVAQEVGRAQRALDATKAALAAGQTGGVAPDNSLQNNLIDLTDTVQMQELQLKELRERADSGDDIPQSQMMQAEYGVKSAHRNRDAAIADAQKGSKTPSFMDNLLRTKGFTPTGGGGVAGTSSLSKFLHMGNDVVGGLIDTGASLAQTAVSAATTAAGGAAAASAGPGGPLAGMAASAAASYGIQLGAAQLKRISTLGFDLAGIGVDSMLAQMSPFGLPRWMGYDYAQFAPTLGVVGAATTTLEQMGAQAIKDHYGQKVGIPQLPKPAPDAPAPAPAPVAPEPSAPIDPKMQQLLDPSLREPETPVPQGGWNEQYPWFKDRLFGHAKGGAIGVYDSGGVLKPNSIAVNKSTMPEKILTSKQWDAMSSLAVKGGDGASAMVQIGQINGLSPEDVAAEIERRQKLAAMQFGGRP